MGRKAIEVGLTGRTVAANIARFRGLRGLTLAELSARMTEVGRPMTGNTLSAIENRSRRADVDDLVAIAAALSVSPAALLMPLTDEVDDTVRVSGGAAAGGSVWDWLTADSPLDTSVVAAERDEFAIEAWRREQVPPWAYRLRAVDRG
ncbi:helix-turn-helix domain-containing protein [Mycolicibacter minnesotensis]